MQLLYIKTIKTQQSERNFNDLKKTRLLLLYLFSPLIGELRCYSFNVIFYNLDLQDVLILYTIFYNLMKHDLLLYL